MVSIIESRIVLLVTSTQTGAGTQQVIVCWLDLMIGRRESKGRHILAEQRVIVGWLLVYTTECFRKRGITFGYFQVH